MSGGYHIYTDSLPFSRCNIDLVGLETIDTPAESEEVYGYIKKRTCGR
jgi:hypothetical protein